MIFKTMDPSEVLEALKGHENVLAPAARANDEFFKRLSCPSCGRNCSPHLLPNRLFRTGDLLPNYMAKCQECGVIFEPYTKIQITL